MPPDDKKFRKNVAFAIRHAPLHIQAFYGRLIEYLSQELGEEMDVLGEKDYDDLADLDGLYKIIIFCTRGAAIQVAKTCGITKSFLVDHGPIHTNRAPHGHVHFEVFSSPYLDRRHTDDGLGAAIKSWSGGYFLSDHLETGSIRKGECLVYLIHNSGWLANSMTEFPFSDDDTIRYLLNLAEMFDVVHVASHINAGLNFAHKYRELFPENVVPVSHGMQFMGLIASVEAVFLEYTSALAACLWNPDVKIFIRVPPMPVGPITQHARYFHELMDTVGYPVTGDALDEVLGLIHSDPKLAARKREKEKIYDKDVTDPYYEILRCVREAISMAEI